MDKVVNNYTENQLMSNQPRELNIDIDMNKIRNSEVVGTSVNETNKVRVTLDVDRASKEIKINNYFFTK